MEFIREKNGEYLILRMAGRLDATTSDAVDHEIDETVRSGARNILLEMSEVSYVSSMGLRVLVRNFKELRKLGGSLQVEKPSAVVLKALQLTKLEEFIHRESPDSTPKDLSPGSRPKAGSGIKISEGIRFEIYEIPDVAAMKCEVRGDPSKLPGMNFQPQDMGTMQLSEDMFSVGLGAFGNDYEDCSPRFGEFIAACGCAAYLPSNESKYPDYLSTSQGLSPEMKVLYSIGCRGIPSSCARFEPESGKEHMALSQIIGSFMKLSGSDSMGIAMIAESAGIVGASLKKSPVPRDGTDFFGHPEIRNRIDFTPERVHERSMCLICGVISSSPPSPVFSPFLRPVANFSDSMLYGHLHAAVFSFHALPHGKIDMKSSVAGLFEEQRLLSVLHLISDDRDISGIGESLFSGGVVWAGKIELQTPELENI